MPVSLTAIVCACYSNGGELFDALARRGSFSEDTARVAFRRIVSAVAALHKAGIVHRDVKVHTRLSTLHCHQSLTLPRAHARPSFPPAGEHSPAITWQLGGPGGH